jgi:hypothetical protein
VIAVRTPKTTPSSGSSPYAPLPTTPEIRITPPNTTGIAASERFSGRSPRAAHASTPTSTTWTLPSTVASPAPTASIEWCQNVRSAANITPATQSGTRSLSDRRP